jgi:hypothetical protein
MASVERIRRALSPRRVRFVGAACVVVSVLFGLDIAVLGGPQPAASSTTQPAGAR